MKRLVTNRGGFTLVEIMIVVAIIALLASIAVPGFLRARKRAQATHILNDLRIIDGAIDTAFIRHNFPERYALKERDGILDPDAIAENYWLLHCQQRSAWTHELDLRPWIETW